MVASEQVVVTGKQLDELSINTIRTLAIDAVQQANSGHPGAPLGMADIATVLFRDFVQFDAADPHWFDRDRFVLSNGHAWMLLYSLLYLTGVKDMTLDELKRFRQIGSKTDRPPRIQETTTGPLGKALQTRWASPSPSAS